MSLSSAERQYISSGVVQDLRLDGRSRLEFRPFSVKIGTMPLAHGSAEVTLGHHTGVACGVKLEIEPLENDEKREEGFIDCSVTCSSVASRDFLGAQHDENAALTSRLQQFIADSNTIDCRALCLKRGALVWRIHVDVVILSAGGNLFDAIVLAVRAALDNTRYPSIKVFGEAMSGDDDFSSPDDVDELDFELSEDDELQSVADCRKMPVCVSLAKIRDCFVIDPSVEEETCSDFVLFAAIGENGELCGMDKHGSGRLMPPALLKMTQTASAIGLELRKRFDAALETANKEYQSLRAVSRR